MQEELGPKHLFIKESYEMAKAVAMSNDWVISGKSEHTKLGEHTVALACAEENKPAIMIEVGSGLPWLPGCRDVETLEQLVDFVVKSIQNLMKWAGMLEGKPQYPESWRKIPEYTMIRAQNGGILRYNKQIRLNASVKKGTVLATIESLLGEEIERVRMPYDGIILIQTRDTMRRPSEIVAMAGYPPETIK
jgi:predicted deacylase